LNTIKQNPLNAQLKEVFRSGKGMERSPIEISEIPNQSIKTILYCREIGESKIFLYMVLYERKKARNINIIFGGSF
jgi:hypothetical protein